MMDLFTLALLEIHRKGKTTGLCAHIMTTSYTSKFLDTICSRWNPDGNALLSARTRAWIPEREKDRHSFPTTSGRIVYLVRHLEPVKRPGMNVVDVGILRAVPTLEPLLWMTAFDKGLAQFRRSNHRSG